MLKWLAVIFLILASLTGCFNEKSNNAPKSNEKKVEQKSTKKESTTSKVKNKENTSGEKNSKINSGAQEDLTLYRPKTGTKKVFVGANNQEAFTEEFSQENDNYVQSIVRIGLSTSVLVYKWTTDEISINSVKQSPKDPNQNFLNGMKDNKNREIMISSKEPSKAIWKVIEKDASVQTPYKSFDHVLVIQKTTNEVKDANTIYTYYLAPQIGIVKETYEVTGKTGYKEESLLQQVKE
jgi:hypothetical protein